MKSSLTGVSNGFKALAHPARLRILDVVRDRALIGEQVGGIRYWIGTDTTSCQRELAAKINMPLSTLAHHLRLLERAGVLSIRKQRTSILLGVDERRLAQLSAFLAESSRAMQAPLALSKARVVILNEAAPGVSRRGAAAFSPVRLYEFMHRAKARYFGGRGGVDYSGFARSAEFAECRQLAWALREYDLGHLSGERDAKAFWLNLYNLLYIHSIVALGVDRSVNEIEAMFGHVGYAVGGHVFCADDIEHGILRCNRTAVNRPRPQFNRTDPRRRFLLRRLDVRIYFALVCGTRSCPAVSAYHPDLMDSQLDAATFAYVNSDVHVVPGERALVLPMTFQWYSRDFDEYPGGLAAFLRRYLPADERRRTLEEMPDLEIRFQEWDWRLNVIQP